MVSIVIPSFNTKDVLVSCVKSIIGEGELEKEIIVVDNASSDGSVTAIKKLKKEHQNYRLTIIENKINLGFAKAVNLGIKASKGDYIFLLNSDTLVKKDSINKILNFAKDYKEVGVVGSKLLNPDGSPQSSCFNFPTILNAIKEYFFGLNGSFGKFLPLGSSPSVVDAVVGAAFLITPVAKSKVGLFDERYFMYFEDIDYCRRVKKAGLKTYYFPDSEVIHYHGLSGKGMTQENIGWKRLTPSSKIYHGASIYYILNAVLWIGQKWQKLWPKS